MEDKILVIDDEENLIELLHVNLQARGFEVIIAEDGEKGLDEAFSVHPDLIILDIRLPKMSGWKVCQKLKSDSRTKDIPVVFLTAVSQKRDFVRADEVGANYYITKPFDPIRLVEKIEKILCKIKGYD
jgi:twitching motility two-component system response regulator PilG